MHAGRNAKLPPDLYRKFLKEGQTAALDCADTKAVLDAACARAQKSQQTNQRRASAEAQKVQEQIKQRRLMAHCMLKQAGLQGQRKPTFGSPQANSPKKRRLEVLEVTCIIMIITLIVDHVVDGGRSSSSTTS